MPRVAAKVTQADIARALRAAAQVGALMAVEIAPDGTIRLIPHEKGGVKGDEGQIKLERRERPRL